MKIPMKCVVFVVAGVLSLGMGVAHAETLQDSVKYMLQTNPDIKAQSYNRLARDQEVVQAKGGYYPTLDLSLQAGRDTRLHTFESDATISRPHGTVLSLRQNVYQFGATQSEVERSAARVRSQAYLIQAASENLALQAARVYLNVLRNQELYELAKENLVNHERIHDQMKLRKQSGVDPGADLDQVLGRLALAQSNLVVTQTNIADAKTDYQALIGRMPENLVKPSAANADIPTTMEDAEKMAVKGYPTLKSAMADLEARQKQHDTARRIMYPKLDVAVDYKWLTDVDLPRRTENVVATAVLSFNVFNGLRNKARYDETLHLISEAQEIMNSTQRQVVQSMRLSWEAYKTAQDRVAYLEEYVKATGLTAEAFNKQWTIGRRTMFDVLDTQAEHINAKSDLAKAKYEKMYAEYRVLNGMGNLVKAFGLQWPAEASPELAQADAPKK